MQVPLGLRFRQVLSEAEHFSPWSMVQQLQEKGTQVRSQHEDHLLFIICAGVWPTAQVGAAAGGHDHRPDKHLAVL